MLGLSFAARCALAEQLEASLLAADAGLRLRAVESLAAIDAADQRLFARLRGQLVKGVCSPAGLLRGLRRHAGRSQADRYSALDVLLAGLFDAGELPDELPQTAEMVSYQPAPGHVILSLIAEVRDSDVVYDLGSGLGRVVLCVALLTAARAIGIEFQPSFSAYAERAAQQVGAHNAEFFPLDARDASFQDGTLFFLYTPFRGELLRSVLAKLRAVAAHHPIRLATFGPCTPEIMAEPWLRLRGQADPRELAIFDSTLSG